MFEFPKKVQWFSNVTYEIFVRKGQLTPDFASKLQPVKPSRYIDENRLTSTIDELLVSLSVI